MLKLLFLLFFTIYGFSSPVFTKDEKEWIKKNQNIKVVMINNFYPFSYLDHNNFHKGLSVDLLEDISKKSGLKFEITPISWSDCLENFKSKKAQIITDISYTDKRSDFTLFSKPYYEIPTFLFGIKKEEILEKDFLINKKVAVSKDIFYLDDLKKQGIIPVEYESSLEKAKAAATGKVDYFLSSYNTGMKSIAKLSLANIKPIMEFDGIKKEDLRIGVSKESSLLHGIIEKTLNTFDEKYYGELAAKWIIYNDNEDKGSFNFTAEEIEFIKNSPSIRVGSIDSYTPFSFIENGKKVGYTQDLLQAISQKSGLKFETVGGTWPEVFDMFKNKNIDIITEFSYVKSREAFTLYTKPYYEIPIGVFAKEGFGHYGDYTSLKNKTVGIVKNSYLKELLTKIGDINIKEIASTEERFKALSQGSVDVVLANTMNIFTLEKLMLKDIKVVGNFKHPEVKNEDLRFGINKDKPILASIINKVYDSIPYSEKTKLKHKWIMENVQYKLEFSDIEKDFIKNSPPIKYSEVNWKPLSIIENNQMKGIMGDYLNLVSNRTGLKFEFVQSDSWPNVLEKFKNKDIDLVPGIGTSPQETSLGLVSDSYAVYPMAIVTKGSYAFIDDLYQLKNKTVAVPKYYTSYNFLLNDYPQIKIIETKDIPEALMSVESGKADAFVGHIATSLYYISRLHLENLKVSGFTDFKFEHKYLVQNGNDILLSIINKTFDSITELEKKDIYSKWVNTVVTEETVNWTVIGQIIIVFAILLIFFIYRHFELKKLNAKLQASQNQMNAIFDNSMEAIIIAEKFLAVDANKEAINLFGFKKKEQILGMKILDFVHKDFQHLAFEKSKEKFNEAYEMDLLKKDGTVFNALIRSRNIAVNNKKLRVVSVLDLTEIKQKEHLLLKQSKMAALGEMIGNIAHQWRQPLSAISTAASGLKLKKEYDILKDDDIERICDSIVSSSKYLSKTIDDFRDFIKGNKKLTKFNIKNVLDSSLNLIEGSAKSNYIEIVVNNKSDITLKGYENELIQAFVNIFYNSIDVLKTAEQDRFIFVDFYVKQNILYVSIYDNGGGIDKKIIDKVFEPYFTTKHQSQGTGLGLYMTYQIIKGMGGEISVENIQYRYNDTDQKGANFLIALPCQKD